MDPRLIANELLHDTIWAWWSWLLLWLLATGLTITATSDFVYPLTFGLRRVVGLMVWAWLLVFVGFGGMGIAITSGFTFRDFDVWRGTLRWCRGIFAVVPFLWAVLVMLTWNCCRDPWMRLPGGPPFRLQDLVKRHPELHFEDYEGNVAVWHGRELVYFNYSELLNATLRFEPGNGYASDTGLGGLLPFPDSRCVFRVRRETPEECEVRYVFKVPTATAARVIDFYRTQLKSRGAEVDTHTGTPIFAKTKTNRWRLDVLVYKSSPNILYVSYFPYSRPAPPKKEEVDDEGAEEDEAQP